MDRAAGAAVHELPGALDADEDGDPRAGGLGREARLVGGEPAAHEARARAPRSRGAADGGGRRLLAIPAAPLARQHDRGRDVGDPPEHHRRASLEASKGTVVDFSFSELQEELRSQAREWVRDRYPLERAYEVALSEPGWDESTWGDLAELGWLGVSVPEEHGGAGLTLLEEAVLLEELGYALYSGPFLVTLAAVPALDPAKLQTATRGEERWSIEVDGYVPELGRVDQVLTADGAVTAAGETLATMDVTRPLGRLERGEASPAGRLDLPRLHA